jgi:hypothetical protein
VQPQQGIEIALFMQDRLHTASESRQSAGVGDINSTQHEIYLMTFIRQFGDTSPHEDSTQLFTNQRVAIQISIIGTPSAISGFQKDDDPLNPKGT